MELPDPDRWQVINDILIEARSRAPDERPAFLDEACGDDEELREEVRTLLDAAGDHEHVFDHGAAALVPSLGREQPPASPSEAPELGRRVGPYRLQERIGEGGTSVVYRAVRADGQFERTVAVKILRSRVGSDDGAADRFRAERQILASLSHPHLAEVYDGGVLDDGRPFLAMEFVDGRPITDHCRAEGLSVDERLRLFRQAADAVQAAHEQLVVHRDLKPSNVLVERTTGQVKLLDFGIAKILGELPGGPVPSTQTGRQPMTPAYAAPEQVKGDGISVATDTYALGVLGYELLTDCRPHGEDESSPYAVARAVCEDDPPPPSTVVETDECRAALKGDLDAIVMTALRKQPDGRYDTVDALLDDVDRYLANRPVRAQRGGWPYRTRKFVQRNRTALVGTVTALLLLTGFAVYHVQRLSAERDRARRAAQKAEQVSAFLTDLFKANDPYEGADDPVTLREVLRQGRNKVQEDLAGQPAVQAGVLTVLGEVYRNQAQYDSARTVLDQALRLRRRSDEAGPLKVAESWSALGTLFRKTGRLDTAAAAQRNALRLRRQHLPDDHEKVAASMNDLAAVLYDAGRLDEAAPLYREALAINRDRLGDDHPNVAVSLNNLAGLYYDQGRMEKAEELYRETLALDRQHYGDTHPYVATDLSSLGLTLYEQEQYEEAEKMLRRSLDIRREELGETHPDVAITLHNLAYLCMDTGRLDEAEESFRAALRIRRDRLDPPHPRLASNLHGLGTLYRRLDRPDEAERYFREAIAMQTELTGSPSTETAEMKMSLADLLASNARYEEAESTYQTALAAYRPLDDTTTTDQEAILRALAGLYDTWQKPPRAQAYRDTLAALYGSSSARTD
jgi:serine/threonine-protein kinase